MPVSVREAQDRRHRVQSASEAKHQVFKTPPRRRAVVLSVSLPKPPISRSHPVSVHAVHTLSQSPGDDGDFEGGDFEEDDGGVYDDEE